LPYPGVEDRTVSGAICEKPQSRQVILTRVLLILVALGLAVFGTIRATRELEPQQRVVAWLVLIVAVVLLFVKLVEMGLLGRATGAES